MRRFKVSIHYEVDTASKAEGLALARDLSLLISTFNQGDDSQNFVSETDFSFREIVHPMNYDKPKHRIRR